MVNFRLRVAASYTFTWGAAPASGPTAKMGLVVMAAATGPGAVGAGGSGTNLSAGGLTNFSGGRWELPGARNAGAKPPAVAGERAGASGPAGGTSDSDSPGPSSLPAARAGASGPLGSSSPAR